MDSVEGLIRPRPPPEELSAAWTGELNETSIAIWTAPAARDGCADGMGPLEGVHKAMQAVHRALGWSAAANRPEVTQCGSAHLSFVSAEPTVRSREGDSEAIAADDPLRLR